ncbi:Phospholipase A I [Colletotrichum trifolii]|uniref:Phospholipase A I n=1 Tax=Colletotrichum trifolii TaxID=5466 RepID=A0A4R8QMM5_COLTR|nr:Phospholipase A I [Colletotrichum trifolii]
MSACDPEDVATCICPNIAVQSELSTCVQMSCPFGDQLTAAAIEGALCEAYPKASRRTEVRRTLIISCSLVFLTVALRLLTRMRYAGGLWEDDHMTIFAAALLVALTAVYLHITSIGFGMHYWTIPVGNGVVIRKMLYVGNLIYTVLQAAVKLSIVLFLRRIFPSETFRRIAQGIQVILLLHGTLFTIPFAVQCMPVQSIWDRTITDRRCLNLQAVGYSGGGLAMAEDIAILLLPIPHVWQLKVSLQQRLAVIALFSVGSFACVTSAVRVKYLVEYSTTFDETWDHVDIVVWSFIEQSVAMLCAISAGALCINGWTVDECIARFESFSNHAFTPRGVPSIPIISSFVRLLMQVPVFATVVRAAAVLLFDSRYQSHHIEQALRDMFGSDKSIADYSAADEMGVMVGMTVATVQDASACIFTNYNGAGQRGGDRGSLPHYELLKTNVNGGQVALWEILRCATAAPYYFTPWSIDGLGTFQDGGLVANNPSAIALQEVGSIFPEPPDPSLLVSVGTGSSARVSEGGGWRDCFPLRLARAFLNRDKNAWQRVVAQKKVGRSGEFFRFDVEFDGPEPPMDCLSGFDDPERDDACTFQGLPALRRLVLCARAELFLFELRASQPYVFSDGGYECCGHIRSRLAAGSGSLTEFMRQLARSKARFRVGGHEVEGDFASYPTAFPDGHFRLEVKFRVTSLQESLSVCLWETPNEGRNISGSPFTVQQLVRSQKLEKCFGTSDHH